MGDSLRWASTKHIFAFSKPPVIKRVLHSRDIRAGTLSCPSFFCHFLSLSFFIFSSSSIAAERQRLIVEVEPRALSGRARDERPAEFRLSAPDFASDRRIDLASLEVVRCDRTTSRGLSGPLPLRWYDDSIPYD